MRTQLRILRVVAGSLLEFGALVALLAGPLGVLRGFLVALAAVAAVDLTYLGFIRPWQVHWGATGEEAMRPMPGDDIAGPSARCTTRAVTIDAPAGQVWPWLTQPGYGRAGWYSYHWPGNGPDSPNLEPPGHEPGMDLQRNRNARSGRPDHQPVVPVRPADRVAGFAVAWPGQSQLRDATGAGPSPDLQISP